MEISQVQPASPRDKKEEEEESSPPPSPVMIASDDGRIFNQPEVLALPAPLQLGPSALDK
eukprot:CAMPEP_0118998902 /NCGR_PEP_ID=MMETSP1173-20130426/63305_1 /TAXON_ID=1034831 /ORGANISM="Rhizochromulina marina cf, Strain CCMP1243" /LENGTH=59 /DNA_ID=CAMNT_0006950403 /DNA_START=492 /DNA_END=671 /DNA_ORIENTATION=-